MTDQKIKFYMNIAFHISKQGTCPRAKVGAVIVRDDRVVSLGYNGAPRGVGHCTDDGCWMQTRDEKWSCVRAAHAEANAVCNAAYTGVSVMGGVIFATHEPCIHCVRLIINSGVGVIYYSIPYPDERASDMIRGAFSVVESFQVEMKKNENRKEKKAA